MTFRHARPLDDGERQLLYHTLLRSESRSLTFQIACVLPERSEMLFRLNDAAGQAKPEFSKDIEAAKRRAGKAIVKITGERFPPFWEESYDRIVRDEAEFEEKLANILEAPLSAGLAESPEDYPQLFLKT